MTWQATIFATIFGFGYVFLIFIARNRAYKEINTGSAKWRSSAESLSYQYLNYNDALNELEIAIHSGFNYSLLRKLTGIAPLMGVVLTALLFWISEIKTGSEQGGNSLTIDVTGIIKPVLLGVFLGATLSILNQFVLIATDVYASQTAMRTIKSIDQKLLGGAYAVLGPFMQDLQQFSKQIDLSTENMTLLQRKVSDTMQVVLNSFKSSLETLSVSAGSAANRLDKSSEKHFTAIESVTHEFGNTVGQMSLLVERTSESLNLYLSETTSSICEAKNTLAEAVATARTATSQAGEHLTKQAELLRETVKSEVGAIGKATSKALQVHEAAMVDTAKKSQEAQVSTLDIVRKAIEFSTNRLSQAADGIVASIEPVTKMKTEVGSYIETIRNQTVSCSALDIALRDVVKAIEITRSETLRIQETLASKITESAGGLSTTQSAIESSIMRLIPALQSTEKQVLALTVSNELLVKQAGDRAAKSDVDVPQKRWPWG